MAQVARGNSKILPVTSSEEIRHFAGPVSDHTVAQILGTTPTTEDLEVAVLYAQGTGDVAGFEGYHLSGNPARIYDILLADEVFQTTDR